MTDVHEAVREEWLRFEKKVAELMKEFDGKWVVFKDDEVVSAHTTEDEAYAAGIAAFGPEGGFVVAIVQPIEPMPLTAGVVFCEAS